MFSRSAANDIDYPSGGGLQLMVSTVANSSLAVEGCLFHENTAVVTQGPYALGAKYYAER